MNDTEPLLREFRVEIHGNGLAHLIFDAPNRSMNVFSNAAIHELAEFCRWLAASSVRGVLIRSGKTSAFCVGADLTELGSAYDMVRQTPPSARFNAAFDHFFPLSAAIRALETAGKPVAAAIAGLALGGGCELAMGAHYRVLADTPSAALGLPESLVGLLPGAGGTQRLPRLVGLERALPMLLDGARLSGAAALDAGLASEVVPPGEEIASAETWLLSKAVAQQPWDRSDWNPPSMRELDSIIGEARAKVLAASLGHYPAPLAILDCLQFGLPQCFDGAIRSEMAIFSHLIQRPEPRNMIQSLFLGKTDYDRRAKRGELPGFVGEMLAVVQAVLSGNEKHRAALSSAGFSRMADGPPQPARRRAEPGYWVDDDIADEQRCAARAVLEEISVAVTPMADRLSTDEQRLADYAAIRDVGYPAYLGGPFAFLGRLRLGDNKLGLSR
jgi:3-hydroxyacyl-CoA dehydrogenase / enoyl-CoA hydratase / 3-hydroxybutyryl-CoA epimerase